MSGFEVVFRPSYEKVSLKREPTPNLIEKQLTTLLSGQLLTELQGRVSESH